jgi:hypothetical protein
MLCHADSMSVYRRLAARWGVTALLMPMGDHPEENVQTTFECVTSHTASCHCLCLMCEGIGRLIELCENMSATQASPIDTLHQSAPVYRQLDGIVNQSI